MRFKNALCHYFEEKKIVRCFSRECNSTDSSLLLKLDRIFFFFFVLLQLLSPSVRPQVKEDVSRRFLIILETFYDLFLNCHDNQAQKADEILSHCPINSFLEISFLSRDVLKKVTNNKSKNNTRDVENSAAQFLDWESIRFGDQSPKSLFRFPIPSGSRF